MTGMTLESLAERVTILEKELAELRRRPPMKDWHRALGMSFDSAFQQEVDAAGRAIREADPWETLL
jgi:hypothetical protein